MREGTLVSDKYLILRKIGEGGMGSVWIARNETTEREFAIKFMSSEFAHSEALTARFLQEAKLAGRLRHPSLLEVFDAGIAPEFGGAPFLVMELLDGIPLDDAIHKAGKLPIGVALEIMSTVAHAMGVVHDKGIVHRDLKPANVFMHRPGTGAIVPKVLDFGISKVTTDDARTKPTGLTQTGSVLGSPVYMSPEQASSDKTIDARSDIHALGVLLWECLVGRPPFDADNYNTLVVEIMVNERPRLEKALPGVSHTLAEIVARAFALKRDNRYPSALSLADALDEELRRMGHVRVLDTRHGAQEFFGLLIRASREIAAPRTSTTSAHAVPARSAAQPPAASPKHNSDAPAGTVVLPHALPTSSPAHQLEPKPSAQPPSRWLIPLGIGAVSVLVVGAVGVAWRMSANGPQEAGLAAESVIVPPALSPAQAASAPVAATASSAVAPPPAAAPSASAPTSASPPSTRTTASPPTTKTSKPPAHHGVDDDGL